jgi:hypothetical protein
MKEILGKRVLWQGAGAILLLQFVLLLLSTPMYEIDTNSFVAGGFSWDIYHNPLLNMVIAACRIIWPNVWFIVTLQCAVYAFCAAFLVTVLFGDANRWRWGALLFVAIEPLGLFFHFSLLSESLFTSFTLLSVGLMILWLRHGNPKVAFAFGLAMGLAFMSKLSSMSHLPLFGLLLIAPAGMSLPWKTRFKAVGMALLPFLACYAFVFLGQKIINEGDIYTVEGRVRWDFSSSMYQPEEVDGPDFKRFVDPYIIKNGDLVQNRELRRELSYLGYKDCVEAYEARGSDGNRMGANRGINACDSIFGAVATQIMDRHFWPAEKQFIRDNLYFLHHLSYIDYRFTPDLHYYPPQAEYDYIDSLMTATFDFNLAEHQDRIPGIWTSLQFGNVYLPIWWYAWWGALLLAAILFLRRPGRRELLPLAGLTAIPLVFHLVYISYRARFFAPYLVLVGLLILWEVKVLMEKRQN